MGSAPRHRQGGRVITEWLGSFFAMIDAIPVWQLYTVVGVISVLETTVLVALVPVIAGTLRMPWGRYGRYTALGAVVWGLVYVGLGSAASIAIRKSAHLLGPTVTTVLVAAVGGAPIARGRRKRP